MNRHNIEAMYPLSPMQQGLLFHSLYAPGSGTYVVQMRCRIQGELDVASFRRSWQTVVHRHSVLRTSFLWEGLEEPLQVVHKRINIVWKEEDWRRLTVSEQCESLQCLIRKDREDGYVFSRAPLMRLALLRTDQDSYYFLWSSHHILFDGWCTQLLIQEVFTCYDAYSRRVEPHLKHPRPFRDYITWLKQQDMKEAEAFWREELRGFASPTPLVGERGWRSQRGEQYEEEIVELSRETTRRVEVLARHLQITVNTVLQGAWGLVLSRHSGERDVVFGAVVSGRSAPLRGIESMVGLFINTLPARVRVCDRDTAGSFLKQLHESQTKALGYEFSSLVKVQSWSEIPRGTPLFESLFMFQNYPVDGAIRERAGSALQISEVASVEKTNYPLTLVAGSGAEPRLKAVYDSGRLDATIIVRLLVHLRLVVEEMVGNAEQRLTELALLTESERQQVLAEWNDTRRNYDEMPSVHELFEEQVERTPEAVAVTYEEQELSYGELNQRANRLARCLVKLGVGPEVRVALFLDRGVEMAVGLVGVLKSGGAYVPTDPGYPEDRVAYVLEDSRAHVVVTQRGLAEKLPHNCAQVLCLDSDWAPLKRESEANLAIEVQPQNLAYVIHTSGSTGRPKGVGIERGGLTNFIIALSRELGPSAGEVLLAVTSLSFDISMLEVFVPLVTGGRVVVANRLSAGDGYRLLEMLTDSRATHMQATPATWRLLVDAGWSGRNGIQVLCGGEALPPDLAEKLLERTCKAWNLYGPTETTIWSTMRPVEENGGIAIGRPIANTQVYILDEGYRPVPSRVAGELYIGGVGLARGYMNRPDLTAERFIPGLFGEAGNRLYRTGDLARQGADGNIEYLGRLDHQVKVRGYRIELGEIESVLAGHDGVRQCVARVWEDQPGNKRLVAYIESSGDTVPADEELRNYVRGRLPDYMVPSAFVRLPQLPLTANGKVDRKALTPPDALGRAVESEEPQTPVEEILANIWSQVLRLEQVGADQNFFELGGHSLTATQMISRVREVLEVDMPVRALFENPTVATLAEAVEMERSAGRRLKAPPIPPVSRSGELPLSFAQQRLWFVHRLEPDSPAYNIPRAIRLRGPLDLAVLHQALHEIVRRHEVLRTRFEVRDGQPMQVIEETGEIELPVWDISDLVETEREPRSRKIAAQEATRPFDLERGPVWRPALVELGAEDHVLLLSLHHVVGDGWSIGILVKEFTSLYEAYREGRRAALPEIPVQYADFAVWQRNWLQSEVLEQGLGYWKQQLAGIPDKIDLSDRPRPPVPSFLGRYQSFWLPASLADSLKQLSRREGVTLFMTLLAAFQVLIHRYTSREDIVVGSAIAGRNRAEIEGLIGFFVNQLVLRTDLSGDPRFRELLARVREVTLAAYAHQDVPFEILVNELRPNRDVSFTRLFQIQFGLQNTPRHELAIPGLALTSLPVNLEAVRYDLTVWMSDRPEGLTALWSYSADLFEEPTIVRMQRHYENLLGSIAANADTRLSALEMQADEEKCLEDSKRKEMEEMSARRLVSTKRSAVRISVE